MIKFFKIIGKIIDILAKIIGYTAIFSVIGGLLLAAYILITDKIQYGNGYYDDDEENDETDLFQEE